VLFNSVQAQPYMGAPVFPKFYSDVAFLEPAEQAVYTQIKHESLHSNRVVRR
jgi:hypothetical protein